jgi:NAD(P)H-hydrate epimerase
MANQTTLTELLLETGDHHHHAYQSSEGIDPEWALWYASYIQTRIWDQLGEVPTRSRLVHLILAAEEAYEVAQSDGEWSPFYAQYLLERLT